MRYGKGLVRVTRGVSPGLIWPGFIHNEPETSAVSLFSLLRKPEWEHRDASRRATAVARQTEPDLLAKLPDLARNDPDAVVRLAAVRRIDDLALLGDRMRNDAEGSVRDAARQRYLQRLLDGSVPLAERQRVLLVEDDADVLASVAEQAPEAVLRRICLERISRPGLMVDRCIKDPDPELRRWLLDRIDDVDTLDRVAERVRKTDKLLARTARERAQAARLASGDPVATRERALAICEELDILRRTVANNAAEQREVLAQEWQALKLRLDEAMERRVQGYFEALDMALAGPPDPAAELPLPAVEVDAPDEAVVPAREHDPTLTALLAELEARAKRLDMRSLEDLEKRWLAHLRRIEPLLPEEHEQERRFRDIASRLRQRFEDQARRRHASLDALPGRIEQLEAAVAAGQVAPARNVQSEIDGDRKLLRDAFPRDLAGRFNRALQELDRLGQWQRWSGNKARVRLIAEVEALAGAGLHPDAVAARLKELQSEWQAIDETEKHTDETSAHPLAARFHAAGRRTLAPARPYFEKRSELRVVQREEFEAFLTETEAHLDEGQPIRELLTLRRQVVDRLRRSDELEPGARRELSRRLRGALDRIKTAISASEEDAEVAKRKVLANLRRDLMHVELAAALPIARQAQDAWKTLPRTSRKTEDALWAELRELVDPLFGQADAKQRERQAEEAASTSQAQAIVEELGQLAQTEELSPDQLDTRLAALQARWRALAESLSEVAEVVEAGPRRSERERGSARPQRPRMPARSRLDERSYDRAVERVEALRVKGAIAERRAQLESIATAADLCDRIEALSAKTAASEHAELSAQLDALALPADARAAVQARMGDGTGTSDSSTETRVNELMILAELAVGLDSPDSARELRRRLQIERLSEHLSGTGGDVDDVRGLLLESLALPGAAAETRGGLSERWQAVLARLDV